MEISLSPFFARLILRFIPYFISHRLMVVCRGYSEDYENFTERRFQAGIFKNSDTYYSYIAKPSKLGDVCEKKVN